MIWCRFETAAGPSFGLVEGDVVREVRGSPFADYELVSAERPLESVKLLPPVIPPTFYAGGVNYERHVIEGSKKYGVEPKLPERAVIGHRAQSSLIGHDADIIRPKDSTGDFQYEGELVAVIGKRARHVSREDALDCVLGWTIGNDVSERGWQFKDPTHLRAKNADTFHPMGPWIVTDLDYRKMRTSVRLNGRLVDEFDTGNMLFDVETHICEISKYSTLYPGDVIWFGTDGVPENMSDGDVVEVEISGIGALRNTVRAEQ